MRRLAWWTGGVIALYAAVGFLAAPPVVRGQLEQALADRLGRETTIERVRINPFALSISIHGLGIKAREGAEDAAGFDELYVNLAASSLLRFAPVIEAVRLSRPFVRFARREDGSYSFQDILDRIAAEPAGPPGPAPRFAVYNVVLADGRIDFDDRPKKARHALTELQVGLPFVSSLPAQIDVQVQPRLSLRFNGAPFEITGETKPFKDSLETLIRIDIDDLQLARYLEYSPVPLRFKVPSGRLDTRLGLTFAQGPGGRLEKLALSGSASLQNLKVQQVDGAPLMALGKLTVHLGSLDFLKRQAIVNSVRIENPELDLVRAKDGTLNLLGALPAAGAKPPARTGEPPFSLSVADIGLGGGALRFTDHTPDSPVRLALGRISLNATGVGNAPEARATLKLATEAAGGKLGYDGALELAPPRLDGTLEATGLHLRPFAPYVEQVLRVAVTGGSLSTRGRLFVEVPQAGPVRAAYRADASVAGFASLDKASSQELLRWKSLALKGIDVRLEPLKVAVDQVALSDFYSRLIVNADGTLNLQTLGVNAEAPAPQAATAAPPSIRIGAIAVRGGTVNFSDYFIRPNFTVLLTGVAGGVAEMTPERAGEVELRGRIHRTAPLEVAGRLNPLARDLYVDLKASARDIELPPLTPYAAKYAGYGIEKGKLSLELAYRIEDRRLVANHHISLDQLTFGGRVESPSATELPVLLAVALLKDRNGVIDIDLPVSGSLDDPEFSVGGLVLKAFVNLIVKAVTSPFALLGAMTGGGEELAYLEFAPGSAQLDAADETKLKSLATALAERPGLRLDAIGRAEPAADRAALKRTAVERQVKAAKLKAGGKTADAAPLDEVMIEPAEYEKYLTAAYRAASFERPRNALGLLKNLPPTEMEKLMLEHAQVSDEELRQLADARARAAKTWLVESGKVAAERVFVVAPRLGAEGIKDKGAPTRVDFSLK